MTIGEQKQKRAFEEWADSYFPGDSSVLITDRIERFARAAVDAGTERGQELRGCCGHRALSGIADPEAWVRSVRGVLDEVCRFGPMNRTILELLRAVERAERGEE